MTSEKKHYQLNLRPQLIDLNQNFKNFRLKFQVLAEDVNRTFQALVVNQEQLDTRDINKLDMKEAKGKIGGSIVADNDQYQNYFLVLKSQEPIEVDVITELEEIAPNVTTPPSQQQMENFEVQSQTTTTPPSASSPKPFYKKPIFWLLLIILLAFAGYYYYQFIYLKNRNIEKSCPVIEQEAAAAPPAVVQEDFSKKKQKQLYAKLAEIA